MVGGVLRMVGGAVLGQFVFTCVGKFVKAVLGRRSRSVVDPKRAPLLEAEQYLARAQAALDAHRLSALGASYPDLGELQARITGARAHLARYIARGRFGGEVGDSTV